MTSAPRSTALERVALQRDDARGLVRLAADCVCGATNVVEAMHQTILERAVLRWLPLPAGTPRVSRLVYRRVRSTAALTGRWLDAALARVPAPAAARSGAQEAMVAALNGVCGDHLAATGNPLAIAMAFRAGGRVLAGPPPGATGRLLVLVHGLGMNDLQWTRNGHDHGQALARDLGFTPVYLHYNSGLHVSQNGQAFSALLDELVRRWPVPLQELVIVGHSMGGLVARSACHTGADRAWRRALSALVCLGTPHHGAPLERGGRLVDMLLGISPYAAPMVQLGQVRSAGVTDLRFGNVQDGDWQQHRHRTDQTHDDRLPTPLPRGVRCYLVAAVKSARASGLHAESIGDGLVPLASAWGRHRDRRLSLRVPRAHRKVLTGANHWDLLSDERVYGWLKEWLTPPGDPAASLHSLGTAPGSSLP